MEAALSPDFTDKVMEKLDVILSHLQTGVNNLTAKKERLILTRNKNFAPPFRHTVIQGLNSGEYLESFLIRYYKLRSCNHSGFISFSNEVDPQYSVQAMTEAINDLFYVSYGLVSELR